jgi:dipeptidase E
MAKMFLLGGERVVLRNAREINLKAFEDAGHAPSVLVFAWARPSFDRKFQVRKRLFDYLRSLGAADVEFADYSDPTKDIGEKISRSSLVYLTGGQLSILVSRLKSRGVDNLLRNFQGVVVGRSAGALALAKQGVVTDRYSRLVRLAEGLSMVDFCVKTHYLPRNDRTLKQLSKQTTIYAISEAAALVCENDALPLAIGDVYLFEKGNKQLLASNRNG